MRPSVLLLSFNHPQNTATRVCFVSGTELRRSGHSHHKVGPECVWIFVINIFLVLYHCFYYSDSVVILAFVKSEGKSTEKPPESTSHSPTEHTSLLADRNSSLEGSLRERVVRATNVVLCLHVEATPPPPPLKPCQVRTPSWILSGSKMIMACFTLKLRDTC